MSNFWDKKTIIIFSLLLAFVIFSIVYTNSPFFSKGFKVVDCYDRYGSVINGITCTKEQFNQTPIIIVGVLLNMFVFWYLFIKGDKE